MLNVLWRVKKLFGVRDAESLNDLIWLLWIINALLLILNAVLSIGMIISNGCLLH